MVGSLHKGLCLGGHGNDVRGVIGERRGRDTGVCQPSLCNLVGGTGGEEQSTVL